MEIFPAREKSENEIAMILVDQASQLLVHGLALRSRYDVVAELDDDDPPDLFVLKRWLLDVDFRAGDPQEKVHDPAQDHQFTDVEGDAHRRPRPLSPRKRRSPAGTPLQPAAMPRRPLQAPIGQEASRSTLDPSDDERRRRRLGRSVLLVTGRFIPPPAPRNGGRQAHQKRLLLAKGPASAPVPITQGIHQFGGFVAPPKHRRPPR